MNKLRKQYCQETSKHCSTNWHNEKFFYVGYVEWLESKLDPKDEELPWEKENRTDEDINLLKEIVKNGISK